MAGVSEKQLEKAHGFATGDLQVEASVTGAAGLAGVFALQEQGALQPRETLGVLLTGAY